MNSEDIIITKLFAYLHLKNDSGAIFYANACGFFPRALLFYWDLDSFTLWLKISHTYHVQQLQLILALISVSKQSNVVRASCLICVEDAAFLVIFFDSRVSSWWCQFLSPTLHQIHPIQFHYRISWQFAWSVIPSEENWMELFQPCCCPSVWVSIAFKRVLQFFNSFFRTEIKDILEVGKGSIYNFLITQE